MILDGCHFEYGTFDSYTYNLIFAHVDTSSYDSMSGSISSQTVFNKRGFNNYLIGNDYSSSPVSFDAEITTCDGSPIPEANRKYIEKTLFNRNRYMKLYVRDQDDVNGLLYELIDDSIETRKRRFYLNCRFMNPSRITGNLGETYGYRFDLECDSLMFWQDESLVTYSNPQPDVSYAVTVNSDIDGYIYPSINIIVGSSGGDITIANETDDETRITRFIDLIAGSEINMRGDLNYITPISYYTKFTGRNFIRLMDGQNLMSIDGDISSISFRWSNRRFIV